MDAILHSTPRVRDAAAEQIRAVGVAVRWPAVASAALLGLVTMLVIVNGIEDIGTFHPERWLIPAVVGLLMPIAVWRSDDLFGAGFLWTLPVDRRKHAFIKLFAGWVWLMAAIAVFFLWLLIMTLVTKGSLLVPETVLYAPDYAFPAKGSIAPGTLPTAVLTPNPLLWLVPFTSASVLYLLSSSVTVGLRYPLRWLAGTLFGLFVVATILSEFGLAANSEQLALLPSHVARAFFLGAYGLDTVMSAGTEAIRIDVTLSNGDVVPVWRQMPSVPQWAGATVIWLIIGGVAMWAAADRHRERRRA